MTRPMPTCVSRPIGLAARLLSSRVALGLAALVLAGSSVWGRFTEATENRQAECRAILAGDLDTAVAESTRRVERGLAAVVEENEAELLRIAQEVNDGLAAFERAIARRSDAVAICNADPDQEPAYP